MQCEAIALHALPAAFHIIRQLFCGCFASQIEHDRFGSPFAPIGSLDQPEELLVIVRLDNLGA